MATFATCQNSTGQQFYINVDLVRLVEHNAANNDTTVTFDNDHRVTVAGPPAVTVVQARGGQFRL